MGEVFFGNVGGEECFDFIVIGCVVNEISCVEVLCKLLDRMLFVMEFVYVVLFMEISGILVEMGKYELCGVGQLVVVFLLELIFLVVE